MCSKEQELSGERGNEDNQLLKNPKILQRLQDIQKLSDNEQEHIFITLDALIRDFKNKKAYAS